jgi:tryptophan 2,3-dioxygenase
MDAEQHLANVVAGLRQRATDMLKEKHEMYEPSGVWINDIKWELAQANELANEGKHKAAFELFNRVIRQLDEIGFMG